MSGIRNLSAAICALESMHVEGCDLPTAINKLKVVQRRQDQQQQQVHKASGSVPPAAAANAPTRPSVTDAPKPAAHAGSDGKAQHLRELAGRMRLKGFERETAAAKAANASGDDSEIIASLESMGAIDSGSKAQGLRELAGRAGLKGYEAETAKAKAEHQPEDDAVIASLRSLGVIGGKDADK